MVGKSLRSIARRGSGRGSEEIDKIIDGKIMGGRIIGNHQSHQ